MKFLQEYLDKEISFSKHKAKSTAPAKQSVVLQKQSVVLQKQSVVYTSLQISKLNLKSLRIEKMHTDVYTGSL